MADKKTKWDYEEGLKADGVIPAGEDVNEKLKRLEVIAAGLYKAIQDAEENIGINWSAESSDAIDAYKAYKKS